MYSLSPRLPDCLLLPGRDLVRCPLHSHRGDCRCWGKYWLSCRASPSHCHIRWGPPALLSSSSWWTWWGGTSQWSWLPSGTTLMTTGMPSTLSGQASSPSQPLFSCWLLFLSGWERGERRIENIWGPDISYNSYLASDQHCHVTIIITDSIVKQ